MTAAAVRRCPCRKKSEDITYAVCCAPFHAGASVAPTAESLMSSRYSAFALQLAPYLLQTWHPSTRPQTLALTPHEHFISLKILGSSTDRETATVAFVARSLVGGRSQIVSETSRFFRVDGHWLYVDGLMSP